MKQGIKIKPHYVFATYYFCVGLSITLFLLINGIIIKNLFEVELRTSHTLNSIIHTIYIFSVIHCMLIAGYWINNRKREVAIRKAFGWENKQIIVYIMKSIMKIVIGSLLLFGVIEALFLQYAMMKILKQLGLSGLLEQVITRQDILVIVALFMGTILVSVIRPMIKVIKEKPIQYMN